MKITIEGSKEEIITFVKELKKRDTKDLVFDCGNVKVTAGEILADEIPSDIPHKKEWTDKQKKDIQMIKDAHKAKRAEKKAEVKLETIGNKKDGRRKDIDNSLIVCMIDEQGKKFKDVAKELNCCEQTVRNRYEQEKKNAKK